MKGFESVDMQLFEAAGVTLWDWPIREGHVALSGFHLFSGQGSGPVRMKPGELEGYILPADRRLLWDKARACRLGSLDMWEALVRVRPGSGGRRWVRVRGCAAARDGQGRVLRVTGMMQDITPFIKSREMLSLCRGAARRYSRILRNVSRMPADLLIVRPKDFSGAVAGALHKLADGAEANKAAVLRNFTRDGELCMRFLYEWRAEDSLRIHWSETTCFRWSDFGDWGERLARGETINAHTETLSGKGRQVLEASGVQSVLFIPVILEKEFWGCIYMSDEKRVRLSDEHEVRALQSGAMLIALSILRNDADERLVGAMEAAQSSARAKTRFLANMSHELRTPMNAILGMAAIAAKSPEKTAECLQRIELASHYLLSVFNDVLDIASLESENLQLNIAPFSLKRLMSSVQAAFAHEAAEKRQSLNVDLGAEADSWFLGDEARVARVLNCIVHNSVKFTPEGGLITVSVLGTGEDSAPYPLQIAVRDTGIGMDKHMVDTVFLPFEQAETQLSRSYEGAGLGLPIALGIVEKMDGVILVESEVGKGSVFTVCLPVLRCTPEAPDRQPAPEQQEGRAIPDFSGKHILLVEDNEINREIVLAMLEETRASVDCAVNGLEACEAITKEPDGYDLVLMDIQMPVMDGLEATEKIRNMPEGTASSVPILAVSANSFPADVERCRQAGMNGLIAKPVNIFILLEAMQEFLLRKAGE